MAERRREGRVRVGGTVLGRVRATVPARVVDISAHGVQLEVACALRPGAVCDLALPHPGGVLRVRATVLRCRAVGVRSSALGDGVLHFRAGLQFERLGPEEEELVAELVAALERSRECLTAPRPPRTARLRLDSDDVAVPRAGDEDPPGSA